MAVTDEAGLLAVALCRCGRPLPVTRRGRPPRWCSDTCRKSEDRDRDRQLLAIEVADAIQSLDERPLRQALSRLDRTSLLTLLDAARGRS